ncbi:MAG TPA: type III secretion system export apparatus subunit SctR [Myxococcales bacterium]|jgi:type III secretion protein R
MKSFRLLPLAVFVLLTPASAFAKLPPVGSEVLDGSFAAKPVPMMALLAAMSLIPFAILMLTSFSKIAVVLSIARSAMGSQQIPPSTVLTGLAVILSVHVMAPVFEDMWSEGKAALADGKAQDVDALFQAGTRAAAPLRAFLEKHGSLEDRAMFLDLAQQLRGEARAHEVSEKDIVVIVPAFVISELKGAFQIGFLVFLPFLVLDMVIANLLLALGMQSLSPTSVSLPFKLLLFVAVDGWSLLSQGLILGYR